MRSYYGEPPKIKPMKEGSPKVSVITPVFNGEKFLQETLDSVDCQTYPNVEHIVIDDGSTDETGKILEHSLQKLRKHQLRVIQQKNAGESQAINRGLSDATGEYVLVLSADDLLEEKAIQELVQAIETDTDLCAVYPDWSLIDKDSYVLREIATLDYVREKLLLDLVCLPGPGALIRRSKITPPLRNPEVKLVSDLEQWMRLAESGALKRLPMNLAMWRTHHDGVTFRTRGLATISELQLLSQTSIRKFAVNRAEKRRAQGSFAYLVALQSLFDKNVHGRRFAIEALLLNPSRALKRNGGRVSILIAALLHPGTLPLLKALKKLKFALPSLAEDYLAANSTRTPS